jgi:starch synthase
LTKKKAKKNPPAGKRGLKVLCCASEVAPFEKTGGLADVTGSLPKALAGMGVETLILMPKYRNVPFTEKKVAPGVTARFIGNEEYFNRAGLYGNDRGDYPDNLQRFSFFCREALETARAAGFRPDIVHAHDWQAALLPVLLKTGTDDFFRDTRSVLTVHNIAYQGQFPHKQYGVLGMDPSLFAIDGFEFYGKINLLKAGLLYADAVTTVSPTYAKEIRTVDYGFGLEGVVKKRAGAVHGILNGIDTSMWDPSTDKRIAARYSAEDPSGKKVCKAELQRSLGLEVREDVPLFAMVTRLAEQKGLDIVSGAADKLLSRGVQFVLLGEGDAVYHTTFANIGKRHPKNARILLGFDSQRAHAVYAGADVFLMPSYFEPCGLGQMISMRYGTVPLVRNVGGLADTVKDLDADPKSGNGFAFDQHSPEKLLETAARAEKLFADKTRLEKVRKRMMKLDFSWDASAKRYLELYKELVKK